MFLRLSSYFIISKRYMHACTTYPTYHKHLFPNLIPIPWVRISLLLKRRRHCFTDILKYLIVRDESINSYTIYIYTHRQKFFLSRIQIYNEDTPGLVLFDFAHVALRPCREKTCYQIFFTYTYLSTYFTIFPSANITPSRRQLSFCQTYRSIFTAYRIHRCPSSSSWSIYLFYFSFTLFQFV